ncbi:MAG: biopolymer transporter ExbD [Lentisphaeria bacterium]|nr:biopolymer transporter ExbD [Lentisphaeria bacterium]
MKRRRRASNLGAIDQINMTPLIDLTFLLLIVFMITMPLVEYSMPVETPQMNASPMPEKNSKIVVLQKDGRISIDKSVMSTAEMINFLGNLKVSAPNTVILLKADGACSYNKVIDLMKDIKGCGFENISLVTSKED